MPLARYDSYWRPEVLRFARELAEEEDAEEAREAAAREEAVGKAEEKKRKERLVVVPEVYFEGTPESEWVRRTEEEMARERRFHDTQRAMASMQPGELGSAV